MVGFAFDWCLHNAAVGIVERRDGSDDDGGAVPTVYAAPRQAQWQAPGDGATATT